MKEYATRRYRSNLISWGMVPFVLRGEPDFRDGDCIFVPGIREALEGDGSAIAAWVIGEDIHPLELSMGGLTDREKDIIRADIPRFNRNRKLTMAAIVIMVVCCIGFRLDTGLFAFIMAAILILPGAADEKAAIKGIPWGTLILICGVGSLVGVIDRLGGITMVSEFLQSFMSEKTAVPILAATSGILSWVSSTTGVVMPALYPVAAQVAEQFAGVSCVELISAITATSFAAIFPLSTGGAIIMSSYSASKETTNDEMNRLFRNLFLLSVADVPVNMIMTALGVFSLGGLFS